MKILVAIDDSASSRAVVDKVGGWSWPVGSTIIVLSAYEMSLGPMAKPWLVPHDEERILKAAREQAQALVDAAVSKLRKSIRRNIKIKTKIAQGQPARVILKTAERSAIDLIVLGSHGHTAWERLFLGSTAHAVALHAKCSVEIVRRRPHRHK
jgi:nucleotide-binding universal stress UspA family protein